LYKPAYGYEMRKRAGSGWKGAKKKKRINRRDTEIKIQCKKEKVAVAMLQSGSRPPPLPKIRKAIALKLIIEYGVSLAETARR
jgi:hypothetical protein